MPVALSTVGAYTDSMSNTQSPQSQSPKCRHGNDPSDCRYQSCIRYEQQQSTVMNARQAIKTSIIASHPTLALHHVTNLTRRAVEIFNLIADEFDNQNDAIAEAVEVAFAEYQGYLANLI